LGRFALVMHDKDNVATAVTAISSQKRVEIEVEGKVKEIKIVESIRFGHKFAIKPIAKGGDIVKYGQFIGKATEDIGVGMLVHIHNVESKRGRGDLTEKVGR